MERMKLELNKAAGCDLNTLETKRLILRPLTLEDFIAVVGRRRVGKTLLAREMFSKHTAF